MHGDSGGSARAAASRSPEAGRRRRPPERPQAKDRGSPPDDALAFQQVADTMWVGTSGGFPTFASGGGLNRFRLSSRQCAGSRPPHVLGRDARGPQRYSGGSFSVGGRTLSSSVALHHGRRAARLGEQQGAPGARRSVGGARIHRADSIRRPSPPPRTGASGPAPIVALPATTRLGTPGPSIRPRAPP